MQKDRSINMNFGSYIKEIRESQNLTLRDVQEAVQISPSYLNRIERGEKKNPGATIIERLAKCYGRPALELFEVALNNTIDLEEQPMFETIIYNNCFTIDGVEADVKIKDAIVSLIKCIANLQWNEKSKNNEIGIVLQNVDNLKICLR